EDRLALLLLHRADRVLQRGDGGAVRLAGHGLLGLLDRLGEGRLLLGGAALLRGGGNGEDEGEEDREGSEVHRSGSRSIGFAAGARRAPAPRSTPARRRARMPDRRGQLRCRIGPRCGIPDSSSNAAPAGRPEGDRHDPNRRTDTMKYLCLAYGDRQKMSALSPAEFEALVARCRLHDAELRATGRVLMQESLEWDTTTIRPRDGKPVTTDGPFVETKETA